MSFRSGLQSKTVRAGIRSWVIGALVFASGVPLLAVYLFTTVVTRQEIKEESEAMLAKMCDQVAAHISGMIKDTEHDVVALAKVATAEEIDGAKLNDELEKFRSLNEMIVSIELLDKDGFLFAASATTTGKYRDLTAWCKAAMSGEWAVSRARRNPSDGELYISVYSPVRTDHPVVKVVKISVSLAPFRNVIGHTQVLTGGDVVLVDGSGMMLERRGQGSESEKASGRVMRALEGKPDAEYTHVVVDVPGLEGTPINGWKVVWSERTSEFLASGQRAEQMVLGVFGLATVVALLTGVVVTRGIAGPLIRLSERSLKAAAGKLEDNVPMEGPMEVRELGWAFNRMLIEARNSKVALEAKVEERTRSLEKSRKQASKLAMQLSASFEAAPGGVLVLDRQGRVLKANWRMGAFFGIEGEVAGEDSEENFLNRVIGCFVDREGFEQVWRSGGQIGGEEFETVFEGVRRTLRISASAVRDGEGKVFAWLWMFHDVTERRLLQQGVQQAQKMEAVGQLAGGVAHDFNNLLTGIDGNLALIDMDEGNSLNDEGRESMAMARESCGRAAALVRGLLGYSRQSFLERERTCLNHLVNETVKLLRATVDPSIRIVTELDPSLGDVHIDFAQVQQIVMNLSLNARDAMRDGGNLILRTRSGLVTKSESTESGALRTSGAYVVLDIKDSGHGIDEAVIGRIFEPFFTTKATGEGTGLGLAMSHGIAQQHGGWIECDSEIGRGSTFSVFLPQLARCERVEEESPVFNKDLGDGAPNLRILVADDEFIVRVVAEGMLRKMGHEVTGVSNGREAVEACERDGKGYDLVVLDMTMPEMSGKDALMLIKREHPDLPVVICSGFSLDFASFGGGGGAKPDVIMQKPYSPEQLERVIAEATGATKQLGGS